MLFNDEYIESIQVTNGLGQLIMPTKQVNKNIYLTFEKMLNELNESHWINLYILWEISLIKQLGFEIDFLNIKNSAISFNDPIKANENEKTTSK